MILTGDLSIFVSVKLYHKSDVNCTLNFKQINSLQTNILLPQIYSYEESVPTEQTRNQTPNSHSHCTCKLQITVSN